MIVLCINGVYKYLLSEFIQLQRGHVTPTDILLKSVPSVKAEAASVYIIQVTKQIPEVHGKAQTVKGTVLLTQRNY